MARQIINIGTTPNDGTGDTVRNAFDKVNDNFDEVYNDLFVPLSGTDAGAPITGEVVFDDDVYATFNSSAGAADLLSINGNGLAIQGENSTSVLNQFGLSCTGGNTGSIIQQVYNYGDGVQTFNFPILGSTDNFIVNWPAKSGTVAMTSDISTAKSFGAVFDGGGSVIDANSYVDVIIPAAMTINSWTILADVTGSAEVGLWKDTYANYPPTVADSITASATPTITSATKAQSSTLTGWTTSVNAGDIIRFNVNSCTNITRLTISIQGTIV